MFSVHIHHGKDKLRSVSALTSKDVIITTYQTLCLDFSIPNDIESEDEIEYLLDHGYATRPTLCWVTSPREFTKLMRTPVACCRR